MSLINKSPGTFIAETGERKKNLWRNNMILLLSLAVLIFIAPLMDHLSKTVADIALILVVFSGVIAAEFQKYISRLLLSFGILVLFSMALSRGFPGKRVLDGLPYFLATLSLVFSSIALVAHVSVAKKVEKSTVLCAINSYLLIGLTASILFLLLHLSVPGSFTSIHSSTENLSHFVYFGFVTLSTLGYGDITPSAPLARSLSVFVALGGQLYLVIVMALIIGKFLNSRNEK